MSANVTRAFRKDFDKKTEGVDDLGAILDICAQAAAEILKSQTEGYRQRLFKEAGIGELGEKFADIKATIGTLKAGVARMAELEARNAELMARIAQLEAEPKVAPPAKAPKAPKAKAPKTGRMQNQILGVNLEEGETVYRSVGKGTDKRVFQATWSQTGKNFTCAELTPAVYTSPSSFARACASLVLGDTSASGHAINGWSVCWVERAGKKYLLSQLRTTAAPPAEAEEAEAPKPKAKGGAGTAVAKPPADPDTDSEDEEEEEEAEEDDE